MLNFGLSFKPKSVYFDLMLGVWDTASWCRVFPFYTSTTEIELTDFHLAQKRIKFAQYTWKGMDLKFYRLNPELNRDHMLKYPLGWAGYTKCEIVSPRLTNLTSQDHDILNKGVLPGLQKIREKWLSDVWVERNNQVANKTYARSDRIFAWSSTEQPLQGSMKLFESEITKRKICSVNEYLNVIEAIQKELETPAQ